MRYLQNFNLEKKLKQKNAVTCFCKKEKKKQKKMAPMYI